MRRDVERHQERAAVVSVPLLIQEAVAASQRYTPDDAFCIAYSAAQWGPRGGGGIRVLKYEYEYARGCTPRARRRRRLCEKRRSMPVRPPLPPRLSLYAAWFSRGCLPSSPARANETEDRLSWPNFLAGKHRRELPAKCSRSIVSDYYVTYGFSYGHLSQWLCGKLLQKILSVELKYQTKILAHY